MGARHRPWEGVELVYQIRGKTPEKGSGCSYSKESVINGASSPEKWETNKQTKYRRETNQEDFSKQIQRLGKSQKYATKVCICGD